MLNMIHVFTWVVILLLLTTVFLRYSWHDGIWLLLLFNMFSLYVYLPAYLVVIFAAVRRRWLLAGVSGLLVAWHLVWVVFPPLMPKSPPPADGQGFRLYVGNFLYCSPHTHWQAMEIKQYDPDLIMAQEVSGELAEIFERDDWVKRYPYQIVRLHPGAFGSAILSKIPLKDQHEFDLVGLPQTRATLVFQGLEVELLNIHTITPRMEDFVDAHVLALDLIEKWIKQKQGKSFIIAGDFNSTPHSRFAARIRPLCNDAWELAGRGYGHTVPNDVIPMPPVQIDHIYLSTDLTVADISLGLGLGSDHKPILALLGQGGMSENNGTGNHPCLT